MSTLNYLNGFGNHFETESVQGALVLNCNSPQKHPLNLYAEQLSGSAFTAPRHQNLHSWLYRIRPSVLHSNDFTKYPHAFIQTQFENYVTPPTQLRWDPLPANEQVKQDFIDGLFTLAGNRATFSGAAIYLYSANLTMDTRFFCNADGEMLLVPYEGSLLIKTEMGVLNLEVGEIVVIPRGIKFQVQLVTASAKGYVCENFGSPFRLPDLGVIGSNGLANPRDFQTPVAAFEEIKGDFTLITKFNGQLWSTPINYSPLDVVAWHGNYAPYKYHLKHFNTINSVSFDHPDPSIFTVLTSPSMLPGVANVDFVIFPPRWMVAEETFRPPYYHRNIMSEYMGLISGIYDAKETGFVPGGGSLHNCMSPHGPDADAYQKGTKSPLKPEFYKNTLAFMFESSNIWQVTPQAFDASFRQKNYLECWKSLTAEFIS